ncbi:DM7 family protein GE17491 [Drosophila eugracilis]|uniref:DM7 family protein GE17491 n=1 Tax=Drosophila eugracilis TaxID=29029 RepID=UPI0007E78C04|nr:DM7 family protein GE17491 [Drosophila eugracilis]
MKRRGNPRAKAGKGVLEVQKVDCVDSSKKMAVINKPKYLPDLRNVLMPNVFCDHNNRVAAARLFAEVHKHDPNAAALFDGAEVPCLIVPRTLFPNRAPLEKITFLPKLLLPTGFDAGGVFGPGVISRRCYPLGLLPPNHRGQTPPLFVGRRSDEVHIPPEVQKFFNSVPLAPAKPMVTIGITQMPTCTKDLNHEANVLEMQMVRNNYTLSKVLTREQKAESICPVCTVPVQCNMYTPDLSNVLVVMPRQCNLTVAMLSTVLHPHVPQVAFATMGDEECPEFELPGNFFPASDKTKRPIFLPKRFLPKGFVACCIYKPGSLPEYWFKETIRNSSTPLPQHNKAITPPLLVGKFSSGEQAVDLIKEIQIEAENWTCKHIKALEAIPLPTMDFYPKPGRGFILLETDDPETPKGAYSVTSYSHACTEGCFVKLARSESTEIEVQREGIESADSKDTQTEDEMSSIKSEIEEEKAEAEIERKIYEVEDDKIKEEKEHKSEIEDVSSSDIAKTENEAGSQDDVDTVPFASACGQGAKKKIYLNAFSIDSDIDLIANAAVDLGDAELELLPTAEPLPDINYNRAMDQLRQILEERVKIRRQTANHMNDHVKKMENDRKGALRKTCCECGKFH